jgi:prepilin-type N-terminal cleavage/methylation domain-containing protein
VEPVQLTPGPTRTRQRTTRPRRGGFTLLEILVVIGIILLLVSIGVIGFRALDQSGKVTKTTLENLRSMFNEYEQRTKLREQPGNMWFNGSLQTPKPAANPPIDLWRTPVVLSGATSVNSGGDKRYDWDAIGNTQIVLGYVNRIPENKQVMTKIPSKQVHGTADGPKGSPPRLTPVGDEKLIDPPLVLDAWNNPIIFVGSDGLAGVTFKDRNNEKDEFRVTSTGLVGPIPTGSGYVSAAERSKSWRPFFASAGPDGDFRTGDDNVYSFEQ